MAMNQDQSRYMFKLESAYGTAVTPDVVLSRVQSAELNPGNNGFIYERGAGEGLNVTKTNLGIFNCGGSVTFNPSDFTFLQSWIGVKSGSGSSGDHYKLTESDEVGITGSTVRAFTFEEANIAEATDDVWTYSGCVGTTFSLQGSLGSMISCTAAFIGQKSAHGSSASSYSASTATSYTMIGGTWSWGATPSTLSGVRDFSINFNNGVSDNNRDATLRFTNQPVQTQREYTGTVSIVMTSALASTIITNFYGQSPASGPVDGSSSTVATADLEFKIEVANGTDNATIWLDDCSIDNLSKPVALGGGLVILSVAFTAMSGRGGVPIEWWA